MDKNLAKFLQDIAVTAANAADVFCPACGTKLPRKE